MEVLKKMVKIALKIHNSDEYIEDYRKSPSKKNSLHLYTGQAINYFNKFIREFLTKKEHTMLESEQVENVLAHAVVIKENQLMLYYGEKCKSTRKPWPDEYYDFSK